MKRPTIYKPKQLDSTFVELVNNNHKNIIGCTDKHTTLDNQDFLYCYMLPLFYKLSFENKEIMLHGNFTNNLLHFNTDRKIPQFVEEMYSNSFIPYINLQTKTTNHFWKKLLDNIFLNKIIYTCMNYRKFNPYN